MYLSRRVPLRRPMSTFPITTRIARMALCVFVFVVFAFGSRVEKVQASCGDYLAHPGLSSKKALSDVTHESLPVPGCKGGHCRSAPFQPPVDSSRVVFPQRQPLDFQPTDTSSNSLKLRKLEFVDDALPSSVTLEVTTPPPILNA